MEIIEYHDTAADVTTQDWVYDDGELYVHDPEDKKRVGFIYIIKNRITKQKYIGKKLFSKAGTKQIKGVKKKIRKESDWKSYYGSSPRLALDIEKYGKENFTRTIIRMCRTRSECNYWETYYIFVTHALMSDEYVNDWVSCKITRMHLQSFLKLDKTK